MAFYLTSNYVSQIYKSKNEFFYKFFSLVKQKAQKIYQQEDAIIKNLSIYRAKPCYLFNFCQQSLPINTPCPSVRHQDHPSVRKSPKSYDNAPKRFNGLSQGILFQMSSCAPDKKFCCHILLYSCFIKLFYRILMLFICCLNLPHIERQPHLTYHQYYKVIGCLFGTALKIW